MQRLTCFQHFCLCYEQDWEAASHVALAVKDVEHRAGLDVALGNLCSQLRCERASQLYARAIHQCAFLLRWGCRRVQLHYLRGELSQLLVSLGRDLPAQTTRQNELLAHSKNLLTALCMWASKVAMHMLLFYIMGHAAASTSYTEGCWSCCPGKTTFFSPYLDNNSAFIRSLLRISFEMGEDVTGKCDSHAYSL